MATRYVPGATSIEIPLRDTDEVRLSACGVVSWSINLDREGAGAILISAHHDNYVGTCKHAVPAYCWYIQQKN